MVELTYLSLKKTTSFVRIFDMSHCVFTQISIGRARWMRNWIPHPTSTHTAYFWWTPLPQKQEIPEKLDDMSKIRTKKVVFFNDKYVNSTIMVDLFYWHSIGSWIQLTKSYFGTFSYKAHFRPQISSNVRDSQITCAFGDSQIKPMRCVAMEILRYSR